MNKTRKLVSLRNIQDFLLTYGFYVLFVVMVVICSFASPVFLTTDNILQIIYGSTSILVVASGVTYVVITGNMDLSVGSVALLSVAMAVVLGNSGAPLGIMIAGAFATGLVCGLINGILSAVLNMNSMLVTLGMMIAYRGIALQFTNGGGMTTLRPEFKMIGTAKVFGINWIIIVSIAIMLLFQFILKHTKFGAYCYAIGCNLSSAERIGLPIKKVKLSVYMISGICAAFVGLIIASKTGTYSANIGVDMEFDVVSVAVIGGTSLLGGRGKIFPGTFMGVLILYLINNGLALFGASPFVYPFAKGLVIFAAMYVDALKNFKRK